MVESILQPAQHLRRRSNVLSPRWLDDEMRRARVHVASMPEISRFFGIAVAMFYREHGPPHFHATYGEHHVIVEIESLVVEGNFPPRAVGLVLAWARLHRVELAENWERARAGEPLRRIPPLE